MRAVEQRSTERGATTLLSAIVVVGLIGVGALAVDIGSALVTKSELQNVGDAGSLAAGRELALIYKELPPTTNTKTYELTAADKARIYAKAATFAALNKAGGASVLVQEPDLLYGTYDPATGEMTPSTTGVRAVSLLARRDTTMNGEMPTALAKVIGVDSLAVRADSTVGLTALGSVPPGEGDIPVGISSHWFDLNACGPDSLIKFFPTGTADGCAGWHTFNEYPANASRLRNIINGMESGSYSSPETVAGETSFNFIGGAVASRFNDMKSLYDANKDGDGNWDVLVPVYQDSTCSNPSGPMLVIGFARARIFQVIGPPTLTITANVECGITDIGTGNGPNDYGMLFGTPLMIQ